MASASAPGNAQKDLAVRKLNKISSLTQKQSGTFRSALFLFNHTVKYKALFSVGKPGILALDLRLQNFSRQGNHRWPNRRLRRNSRRNGAWLTANVYSGRRFRSSRITVKPFNPNA